MKRDIEINEFNAVYELLLPRYGFRLLEIMIDEFQWTWTHPHHHIRLFVYSFWLTSAMLKTNAQFSVRIGVIAAIPFFRAIERRDDKLSPLHFTNEYFRYHENGDAQPHCLRNQQKIISHHFCRWFDFNCIFSFVNTICSHRNVRTIPFSQLSPHQKYYYFFLFSPSVFFSIFIFATPLNCATCLSDTATKFLMKNALYVMCTCRLQTVANCIEQIVEREREKIRNNQRDVPNYQFIIS